MQVRHKIQRKLWRDIKHLGIYRDVYGYILGVNPDGLRWKLALCFHHFADPEPGDCNIL